MVWSSLKIYGRRHTVHPSTSGPKLDTKGTVGKAPYGSWCTPETTPAHNKLTQTISNVEKKSQLEDDTRQNQVKGTLLQVQKVRLFTSKTPIQHNSMNDITEAPTELKEIKEAKSRENSKKQAPVKETLPPAVETPQSPVPSSPSRDKKCRGLFQRLPLCDPFVPIDPQGRGYISWLMLVTFCYSYNAWCIALRATFPYQTPENTPIWMAADYFCDLVYLLDVGLVKPRLMFLHEGFWVDDLAETRKNYMRTLQYKFDVISLMPLDLLYIYFGTHMVILRFPRLLKLQTFWEFHQAMDRVLSSPYVVRIGKTLFYIFYLIHLNACAYYAMSDWIGLGSNEWVYNNEGNAYIRCFYFATKTATSIGKNPKPENTEEYLFMTAAWLMGVFVFALLIGQIRDIIATATRARTRARECVLVLVKKEEIISSEVTFINTEEYLFMKAAWLMDVFDFALLIGQIRDIIATATRARAEYRKTVDGCSRYLRRLNMPAALQRRVTCWFNYTWSQQRCFDESKILNSLPFNMKRDVALAVHMSTLSKVQLFRDCSDSLLRDLVLQLRPVSFLPGDVVVRRGDVGHQMYIIKAGTCYVMSQDENEVLATLREGSVFGEISLLGIEGLRRRTATVRSRGYSNLFALSRNDLEAALKHHKEAAQVLRLRADQIIRENAARQTKQRIAHLQAKKSASLVSDNASVAKNRRLSSVSSNDSSSAVEGKRHRSASALSKRRLSAVSENKDALLPVCRASMASARRIARTPLPTIVLSAE